MQARSFEVFLDLMQHNLYKLFSLLLTFVMVLIIATLFSPAFLVGQVVGQDNPLQYSKNIESISLRNLDGDHQSFSSLSDKKYLVVVFIGIECPLAKIYLPRIAALADKYKDVAKVVGVNSNSQDSMEEIKEFIEQNKIPFKIYKDPLGKLATALNATRTPEAFVVDQRGNTLYQGRIDDQYGVGFARSSPQEEYLKNALESLRHDQSIGISHTQAIGCFIGRSRSPASEEGDITYHNKVNAIIQKHCVECHREGEIGPFSLTNYNDVAAWAETIGEVIEQGRMPPWHANPAHGSFANTRRMSKEEKDAIFHWIKDDCPQGTGVPEQTIPKAISGWQLNRSPDLIIPMREQPFTVPAEGTVEYQYFVADPGFTEDRWVTSAEVVPSNRGVVHHAIVFISPPDQQEVDSYGWLSAYVPGQRMTPLEPGQARKIPAGSQLIFQMHYTPNGSIQQDQTKVGLVFTEPEKVNEEIITLISANRHFKIPPGVEHHRVHSNLTEFPQGAKLTSLTPHMHLRGKSFRITHQDKSDNQTILLDVPQYDFNWQHIYRLKEPLPLSDTKKIECTAHFDNSVKNAVNPDPTAVVRWGDQSWEEMMISFFEISVPRNRIVDKKEKDIQQQIVANRMASEWLSKWDQNQDSRVQRNEVGESFRRFAFAEIDQNNDQEISLIETAAYISDTLSEEKKQEDIRKQLEQVE